MDLLNNPVLFPMLYKKSKWTSMQSLNSLLDSIMLDHIKGQGSENGWEYQVPENVNFYQRPEILYDSIPKLKSWPG